MDFTSCISHPQYDERVRACRWQIWACDESLCGAMLLNFFEKGHNHQLKEYYKAERKGVEPAKLKLLLWMNITEQEFEDGLLGYFKRDNIRAALKLLQAKKYILIDKNPSGDKKDRSNWFRFLAHNVQNASDEYSKKKFGKNWRRFQTGGGTFHEAEKPAEPKPDIFEPAIQRVFAKWKEIFAPYYKREPKLTDTKKTKIRARLKDEYTEQDIIEACAGAKLSDWHIENLQYDITKICKDGTALERHQQAFLMSHKTLDEIIAIRPFSPADAAAEVVPEFSPEQMREVELRSLINLFEYRRNAKTDGAFQFSWIPDTLADCVTEIKKTEATWTELINHNARQYFDPEEWSELENLVASLYNS